MVKFKGNHLLWVSALVVTLYWVIAPFIPNPHLSSFISLLILVSGSLTLAQYAWPTYHVVVRGVRSQDDLGRGKGSHLAIYGTFLFALGCICLGAYGLWWNYQGQPEEWIGSAASQFGRACLAAGFVLMMIGPSMTKIGFQPPGRWWYVLAAALILIGIGFYLGMQVQYLEVTETMRLHRLNAIRSAEALN